MDSATPLLFTWGRHVPASDPETPVPRKAREPISNAFFSSQNLKIVDISFGESHAVALDNKGGLWAWGEAAGPMPRQLKCDAKVTALASSASAFYALTSRGTVLEWRDLDAAIAAGAAPKQPAPLGGALRRMSATAIAAGEAHVVVVGSRGEVAVFGDNAHGQLGLAAPEALPRAEQPTLLTTLPAGSKVTRAACGHAHSLLLLSDGSVFACGDDHNLQLGLRPQTIKQMRDGRTMVPLPERIKLLPDDRKVVDLAAGGGGIEGGHSIFVTRGAADDGDELWACGYGRFGQLGIKAFAHQSQLKQLSALAKLREYDEKRQRTVGVSVVSLACGERHTAVLLNTGNVFVWGWNDHGQLGSGGRQGTHTPELVRHPPELRFSIMRGLACGPNSTAVWN